MEKNSRILLALTVATLLTLLAGTAITIQILTYAPNFEKLRHKASVAIRKKGEVIGYREVGPETPSWVRLESISNLLIGAVVSSEDASFFGHPGIDLHELKESLKKDLREKRWARGGSTITQQVVKNVYLSQEKTLWRKFREILWAWDLDRQLSKSEILCFYLNMAQWGPGIYGIGSAASHYFGTDPVSLTARESAFLALLLPAPEKYYSYFRKRELTAFSKRRIEQILKIMLKMGYLEADAYEGALRESLWGENPEIISSDSEELDEENVVDFESADPTETPAEKSPPAIP